MEQADGTRYATLLARIAELEAQLSDALGERDKCKASPQDRLAGGDAPNAKNQWHPGNHHLYAERTMRLFEAMARRGAAFDAALLLEFIELVHCCGPEACGLALQRSDLGMDGGTF